MTDDVEQTILNLFTPQGHADPYPGYDRLRTDHPVAFHQGLGAYFLTRYADIEQLLSATSFGTPDPAWADEFKPGWRTSSALTFMHTSLLYRNPPDHTRLRRLVGREFTARRVQDLRPAIERIVTRVLDTLAERTEDGAVADLQDLVSFPLAVAVIGDLIGVPGDSQAQWRWLVDDMAKLFDPVIDEPARQRADRATETMFAYFRELLARRRAEPGEDLFSALITARDETGSLTDEELVSLVALIFGAGFETTVGMIGNGIHALFAHPAQLDLLRSDPSCTPGAITEVIRYDGSAQMVMRVSGADTEIGGVPIPAGAIVIGLLGAANRDPERFDNPGSFDIRRKGDRPLTFGGGIHFCLGSTLARTQGEILYTELFRRFPTLHLAAEPQRRKTLSMRGFDTLPVAR